MTTPILSPFLKKFLSESTTSDGATLYMVWPATKDSVIEDVFYELDSEQTLFNVVRGASSSDLLDTKLFVNKSAAMALANQRIADAQAANPEEPTV